MLNLRSYRTVTIIAVIILLAAGSARSIETGSVQSAITMEFVRIPAGSFYIEPAHQVEIKKPFYMGKYEVTQAQWKTVMGTTVTQQHKKADSPWHLKGVGPEYPMYYVSWKEATEFCKRLGKNYRLPSESEWEYACRAGSKTRFHYGDDPNYSQLDSYEWYYDNSKGSTHPVGQKKPNEWDLYDMHSNVSEWCSENICKGGNWIKDAKSCNSSARYSSSRPRDLVGFRIVFAGNINNEKKVLKITLPEKASHLNIFQKLKSKIKPDIRMAITGTVRDQAGIPIDGAFFEILPPQDWILRQYPEGRFEAYRYTKRSQNKTGKYHFYARHLKRNLFTFTEFEEDVNALDIRLQPGAILTGKVTDVEGRGIKGVKISLYSHNPRILPIHAITEPDEQGKFEIKGLPLEQKFIMGIRAKGYQ